MSSLATTETTVLQLMKTLNRPCSVNCLIEKGNAEFGKSSIQKALDNLVRNEKVMLKEYGKQKIYTLKQEVQGDPEMIKFQLRTLDTDIASAQQKLKEKSGTLKNLQNQLKQQGVKKSVSSLRNENSVLLNKIADTTIKIGLKNDRSKSRQDLSPAAKKEIKQKYEKYLTAYQKRKNLCKEMIETIMEGYPGTKKKLLEDIGLETDEDVGFVYEPLNK